MVVVLKRPTAPIPSPTSAPRNGTSRIQKGQFQFRTSDQPIEVVGVFVRLLQKWDDVKLIRLEDDTVIKVPDPNDELKADQTYRFHGKWTEHHKFGKQFRAESFAGDTPITKRGTIHYLAENCDNIGQATATKIWNAFGDKSCEVVRDNPEKLVEAGILDLEKAQEAAAGLKFHTNSQRTKIDLLGLFKGYGLGEKAIQGALLEWGARAGEVVRRDPFKLMVSGVPGAGYLRCDRLYRDLGLPMRRLKRQMLKLWYSLQTDSNGHTWFDWIKTREVEPRAVQLGLRAKWLVTHEDHDGVKWITERRKADAEAMLAIHLKRLASWKPTSGDQTRTNWPAIERIEGISDHQREKAGIALQSPVAILAGSPGTGKTYVAAAIIRLLSKFGMIHVCAPTGKAAVRVQESLMRVAGIPIEATTIHKLCGIKSLDSDEAESGAFPMMFLDGFVIVDETSMVDVPLMARLLASCKTGTHILFLGDPYQLPPVGHGAPLRDMLTCSYVTSGELTEIQRNAGQIVKACASIKSGRGFDTSPNYNPETGDNLKLVESSDAQDTLAGVLKLHEIVPQHGFDPVWDTQVLVAVNTKGPCARVKLNKLLQQKLNPDGYTIEKHPFRVGDKLICLKNNKAKTVVLKRDYREKFEPLLDKRKAENYIDAETGISEDAGDGNETNGEKPTVYVANGELGRVIAIGRNQTIAQFENPLRLIRILHGTSKQEINKEPVNTDDGLEEEEPETSSSALQYDLGYAITTHKAQGSEAPCVIVVIDPLGRSICTREHLYTSISRAKKLCLLVGQKKVADQFCREVAIYRRKTFLKQILAGN